MEKTAIAQIVREANASGPAPTWRIRELTQTLSAEEFRIYSDLQAAKDRLVAAERDPDRRAEYVGIAALICSQVGVPMSEIE